MSKLLKDFLSLFFPNNEGEEENPLTEKIVGFILIVIAVVFVVIASGI